MKLTKKKALQYSISHWLWDNVENNLRIYGGRECPLCTHVEWSSRWCVGCILKKYKAMCRVFDSPYRAVRHARSVVELIEAEWNMAEVLIYIYLSEYREMPDLNDVRVK